MNILFVSSKKKWGGVISLQVRTALELQKRGHRVHIISAQDSALTERVPSGVPLTPKKFGMDFNPRMIAYLAQVIRREAIEVVITNIKKEVIAGGLAARLSRVPCIRIIGNEKDADDNRILQKWLVNKYIVPCHTTRDIMLQNHPWLKSKPLVVIHNGHNLMSHSDEQVTALRTRWGLGLKDLAIGVTARLVRSKGIGFLIESFATIAGQRPHTYLIVTGEGKFKEEFKSLTMRLKLKRRVRFVGFSRDPVLNAAAYDVAVLPSDYESFPFAIVEYFAAGCPVIATRVGGVEEIIQHGRNGLLVDARDRHQMSESLLLLCDDEHKRRALSRAAADTIRRAFSQDLMIDRYEQTLAESCAS